MKFPSLVYRCPGDHQCQGGTYAFNQTCDEEQFAAALKDGWHATLPEALAGKSVSKAEPAEDAPPTRAELEQKADELGITFSPNIGDKKLAEKIAASLKG